MKEYAVQMGSSETDARLPQNPQWRVGEALGPPNIPALRNPPPPPTDIADPTSSGWEENPKANPQLRANAELPQDDVSKVQGGSPAIAHAVHVAFSAEVLPVSSAAP